jgi:hypothetical protein
MDRRLRAAALYRNRLKLIHPAQTSDCASKSSDKSRLIPNKYSLEPLAFLHNLWHSNHCVGERPMIVKTQNSMHRLGWLELSSTGRRARIFYLP